LNASSAIGLRAKNPAGAAHWAARLILLVMLCALGTAPSTAAVKIQEVKSRRGVTAWLVEDHTIPMVTIRFAFKGGSAQEPEDKLGMARLMSGLFDEGAGDMDSEAFQIALDDAGAEMGFTASRDSIMGSMRTLEETRDASFGLLRLAVNAPRFDQPAVDRIRSQLLAGLRARQRDPDYLANNQWLRALYGAHPYGRGSEGAVETLAGVTPQDIRAFRTALFARSNLTVGVVGAIDAPTLAAELDRLFGDLPSDPTLTPPGDADPRLAQEIRATYPVQQTTIRLAYPGVRREDPRFMAAFLMNHILGGGEFTSRLFREVRERRGLSYGIDSSLVGLDHAQSLMISTSTSPAKGDETLQVIRDVVAGMASEGPTEAELAAAKRHLTGAYAIENLNSSSSIAATLVGLQQSDLGIDYLERRGALIDAVTVEDVRAVARELLSASPALMTVGPEPAVAPEPGP
jgi:zinc protease